ncbi:MAG: hypothetical protein HY559_04975 [Gammaproteobacteria bacterium]|nr:hypothetical protein [Gammaproteobacteria bacterium]
MSLQDLFNSENRWVSLMGKVFPTERVVFRGKDLHLDLKDLSWFELYLYGITGRFFSERELKILNYIWVSTSYPDPRVWNNRVAALAGTTRSTGPLALGASISVSEATLYGGRPFVAGIDFFLRAQKSIEEGCPLDAFIDQELKACKTIYGYGRAMVRGDERVPHMIKFIRELNFDEGTYVKLAFEVENILKNKKQLVMNIGALYNALAADLGLSPFEYSSFMILVFVAGMAPCYMEAAQKKEGCFFPIRCSNLVYEGAQKRRKLGVRG